MKSEITRIAVLPTAKTFAFAASILTLFLSALSLVALAFGLDVEVSFKYIFSVVVSDKAGTVLLLLAYPILTFVVTYLTVLVLCLVYNTVAKYTGGIKVQLRDLS